eukprot:15473486-Alexandrium_andersonii.AAC.1
MISACRELDLLHTASKYEKPPERKVTFRAPGAPPFAYGVSSSHYAELDHCLISRRWANAVLD